MSYTKEPTMYLFATFDYGGGSDGTFRILGPKGKKGVIVDAGVINVTEAFAAGTALPQMSVGTAADRDAYVEEFSFGALALGGGKSLRSTYDPGPDKTSWETYVLADGVIPADVEVVLHAIAGTGSGLTGQAQPFVAIRWDD